MSSRDEIKRICHVYDDSEDRICFKIDDIYNAMDLFAQKDAISFAEFINGSTLLQQRWMYIGEGKWELLKPCIKKEDQVIKTSEELYELYQQSKNKDHE